MGPLSGLKVIEMAGLGPAPFCGMLLADLGAEVLSIQRVISADLGFDVPTRYDLLNRNKQALAVDLKSPEGVRLVLELIHDSDLLIEGFRPGVMERLGLGPEPCMAANPGLIYGRMTGWGQTGPLAARAGHDINYIAMSGALAAIGPSPDAPPVVPLNYIGDFGGGALYLALGLLAALRERQQSGLGQVVDAAMVDGVGSLMTMHYGYWQAGQWDLQRGSNTADGGSPWYTTYRTKDGGYMAVGAVEKRFYAELLAVLGLADADLPDQNDRAGWPRLRTAFAEVFETRTRDEWEAAFDGIDACVTPVLDMAEAPAHELAQARGSFLRGNGVIGPAPAPRFSRSTPADVRPPPVAAQTGVSALRQRGIGEGRIADLIRQGVVAGQVAAQEA